MLRDGRWFWWVLGACVVVVGADTASLGPFAAGDDDPIEVEVLGDQIERAPDTTSSTAVEPAAERPSTTTSTTAIEWTPMPILPPDAELPPPTEPPSPVTTTSRTVRSAPVRTTAAPAPTATTAASPTIGPVGTTTTEDTSIPAPTTTEEPTPDE